jgi:hypothetical protein
MDKLVNATYRIPILSRSKQLLLSYRRFDDPIAPEPAVPMTFEQLLKLHAFAHKRDALHTTDMSLTVLLAKIASENQILVNLLKEKTFEWLPSESLLERMLACVLALCVDKNSFTQYPTWICDTLLDQMFLCQRKTLEKTLEAMSQSRGNTQAVVLLKSCDFYNDHATLAACGVELDEDRNDNVLGNFLCLRRIVLESFAFE